MAPAPWDNVPAEDTLFVLITGANSGIGFATCQRLIDEFLTTRPRSSHLILLPTTRSANKSIEAVTGLREYATTAVARTNPDEKAEARIHVLSPIFDLCDLRSIHELSLRLRHGTISNPQGVQGEYLKDVRIPKLDSVIFNAAYGGWIGPDFLTATWHILTEGLVPSVTWPRFKRELPSRILNQQPRYRLPESPVLGEVFCACVFGHYVLAHQLMPLLSRRDASQDPGRIIWSSSLEALSDSLSVTDIQCFQRLGPYESAKRLTDVLSLTSSLPSVQPYSNPFFSIDDLDEVTPEEGAAVIPPKHYLSHPGVVISGLFPVPWFLMWAYRLALLIARALGSPWHTVDAYAGSKSAAWLVLEPQEALDEGRGDAVKWGSTTDIWGEVGVKKTEVEGWGWQGKVESIEDDDEGGKAVVGIARKAVGRRPGVQLVTEEEIVQFEELGMECWREMERIRVSTRSYNKI